MNLINVLLAIAEVLILCALGWAIWYARARKKAIAKAVEVSSVVQGHDARQKRINKMARKQLAIAFKETG